MLWEPRYETAAADSGKPNFAHRYRSKQKGQSVITGCPFPFQQNWFVRQFAELQLRGLGKVLNRDLSSLNQAARRVELRAFEDAVLRLENLMIYYGADIHCFQVKAYVKNDAALKATFTPREKS